MTAPYIQRRGIAFAALRHIQRQGMVMPRVELVAFIRSKSKSPDYADEVIAKLITRGFLKSGLVQITEAGRAAVARAGRRATTETKEGA